MIQVIPVRRAYVSMSCDWPGCGERIDFPEGIILITHTYRKEHQ